MSLLTPTKLFDSVLYQSKLSFDVSDIARLYACKTDKAQGLVEVLLQAGKLSSHYRESSTGRITWTYCQRDGAYELLTSKWNTATFYRSINTYTDNMPKWY